MTGKTAQTKAYTTSSVTWSFSWILYKRPAKRLKNADKIDFQSCVQGSSANYTAVGILEHLSMDKIMNNETQSPCSVTDFLNYLRYIEHSPEHLEFWLWHEDYTKRFEALTDAQKALSPVWNDNPKEGVHPKETGSPNSTLRSNSAVSRGSSLDEKPSLLSDEFLSQPFRAEISNIVNRYILAGGARELNISSRDRETALQALSTTTHPSAVLNLKADCDNYLRHQYHPNFIRWVIANCTTPRMNFAYMLGAGSLVIGTFISLLLTLSSAHRAWRLFGALVWFIGIVVLVCGWKGICVVLMAMGHCRLLEPWEIPYDDIEQDRKSMNSSSFEDVIPDSWDDAPWMQRDMKKPWLRRVFGDTAHIEDKRVTHLQDVILLQAAGLAILGTIPFVAIFLSIPSGHLI